MTQTNTPGRGWKRALERLPHTGATVAGRYTLTEIGAKALTFTRATGKTVKVTAKTLNKVWLATADGGRLAHHQNWPVKHTDPKHPKGGLHGISYTVAVEACVVAALGLVPDTNRNWRRA